MADAFCASRLAGDGVHEAVDHAKSGVGEGGFGGEAGEVGGIVEVAVTLGGDIATLCAIGAAGCANAFMRLSPCSARCRS